MGLLTVFSSSLDPFRSISFIFYRPPLHPLPSLLFSLLFFLLFFFSRYFTYSSFLFLYSTLYPLHLFLSLSPSSHSFPIFTLFFPSCLIYLLSLPFLYCTLSSSPVPRIFFRSFLATFFTYPWIYSFFPIIFTFSSPSYPLLSLSLSLPSYIFSSFLTSSFYISQFTFSSSLLHLFSPLLPLMPSISLPSRLLSSCLSFLLFHLLLLTSLLYTLLFHSILIILSLSF